MLVQKSKGDRHMPPRKTSKSAETSVQDLLEARRKHKEELEKVEKHLGDRLEEAFESVWTERLKPILNSLHESASGVLKDFSDFDQEFRNYMRVREPDINIDLLEDILHSPSNQKPKEPRTRVKRTAEEKARLLKKYEQAKGIGLGSVYLQSEGIKTASQIAKWKDDPEVQKRMGS